MAGWIVNMPKKYFGLTEPWIAPGTSEPSERAWHSGTRGTYSRSAFERKKNQKKKNRPRGLGSFLTVCVT